jgi:hypothetical protein
VIRADDHDFERAAPLAERELGSAREPRAGERDRSNCSGVKKLGRTQGSARPHTGRRFHAIIAGFGHDRNNGHDVA